MKLASAHVNTFRPDKVQLSVSAHERLRTEIPCYKLFRLPATNCGVQTVALDRGVAVCSDSCLYLWTSSGISELVGVHIAGLYTVRSDL